MTITIRLTKVEYEMLKELREETRNTKGDLISRLSLNSEKTSQVNYMNYFRVHEKNSRDMCGYVT